ncbi:MAG TPA: CvpA family protein [Stellaceae bacterium]|nr:CvpA family protein [Stellaceae bacterium]
MNPFDIGVIVVIALSGLFAFARGIVKELLSVAGWIAAGIAALYGFPYAAPFAERFIPRGMFANLAAGIAIFVVALIIFSLMTSAIARRVKESSLASVDHSLGLLFGIARGAVIACLLYYGLTLALPEASRPDWIKEARSTRYLAAGADFLISLVPPSVRGRVESTASDARQKVEQIHEADSARRALETPTQPQKPESQGDKGYTPDMRKGLDKAIEQTNQQ